MVPDNYHEVVLQFRRKKRWTQVKLARFVGLNVDTIYRWENRRAHPTAGCWQKIVDKQIVDKVS